MATQNEKLDVAAGVKHTPGPWSVGPSHVVARRYPLEGGGRVTEFVAECVQSGASPFAEVEANARLIAAAPELLEALSDAIFAIETKQLTGPGAFDFAHKLKLVAEKARGVQS